jgi:hypothetical protein
VSTTTLPLASVSLAHSAGGRRGVLALVAWMLAAMLPLVGLVSLLLREQLDVDWGNYRVHFALFLTVGMGVFMLA